MKGKDVMTVSFKHIMRNFNNSCLSREKSDDKVCVVSSDSFHAHIFWNIIQQHNLLTSFMIVGRIVATEISNTK